MDQNKERIRWSPRIRPALIKRLYESDALGLQDDDLCNEVGFRLFLRCQSIVMVSKDEVTCPRCGTVFVVKTLTRDEVSVCPARDCSWQTTMLEYHQSWSKRRIWGANALPAIEEFYKQFSPKQDYKTKMFRIDLLIHSFHWSLKENLPARSVANNLIEGDHDQVVEFLDRLTGVDPGRKEQWRETMQQMMRRRKGK